MSRVVEKNQLSERENHFNEMFSQLMKNCFPSSQKTKLTSVRWKYSWYRSLFYLDKKRWNSISRLILFIEQNAKSSLRKIMKNKKKSLIVQQNFSFVNSLQEQSEAETEKKISIQSVFKARRSSIIHHLAFRRFRSMSWFNSFINFLTIRFPYRSSVLSVCMKNSITVFCVEEEKIRLTVLFRSAADKCSAPGSPISLNWRLSVLSVCVKKSICVFCVEAEKARLTVLFRSAADKSSASLFPILFLSR